MSLKNYNWIKQAATAAAKPVSADEVERAFLDLGYGYITQKAGKLLDDPYRLGFEVVYSNDDNSKMAGVFAFRIGKTLLSIPCFFINSDVKGTDLLYQHDKKLFRPLTEEWTDYLISQNSSDTTDGSSVPKSEYNKLHFGMRLDRLARPIHHKHASEDKNLWKELFSELENLKVDAAQPTPVLRDFIVENYNNGVMEKMAYLLDRHIEFAEAIANVDESQWLPELTESEYETLTKVASVEEPKLTLIKDGFSALETNEEKLDATYKRGWMLVDTRDKFDLNPTIEAPEALAEEIKRPGKFEVILNTKETETGIVLWDSCGSYDSPKSGWGESCTRPVKDVFVWWPTDKTYSVATRTIYGLPTDIEETETLKDFEEFKDSVSAGEAYLVVDFDSATVLEKILVDSTSKREDDITTFTYYTYSKDKDSTPKTGFINPDAVKTECRNGSIVVNLNGGFLPIKHTLSGSSSDYKHIEYTRADRYPGTEEDSWSFLLKGNLVTLKAAKDPNSDMFSVDMGSYGKVTKVASDMAVFLAGNFNVSAEDATSIVSKTEDTTWVVDYGSDMKKSAATIQIIDTPEYKTEFDSDLATPYENTQNFALQSRTSQPVPPQMKYGDASTPGGGENKDSRYLSTEAQKAGITDDMLFKDAPEKLQQLTQGSQVPNLLEHGLVGSLISTYDSGSLIGSYIPKLEDGLDHLGRLLFLIYWKPTDFEKLYGSDDLPSLENKLISQFKSFGDILLDLIKKNTLDTASSPF